MARKDKLREMPSVKGAVKPRPASKPKLSIPKPRSVAPVGENTYKVRHRRYHAATPVNRD